MVMTLWSEGIGHGGEKRIRLRVRIIVLPLYVAYLAYACLRGYNIEVETDKEYQSAKVLEEL